MGALYQDAVLCQALYTCTVKWDDASPSESQLCFLQSPPSCSEPSTTMLATQEQLDG